MTLRAGCFGASAPRPGRVKRLVLGVPERFGIARGQWAVLLVETLQILKLPVFRPDSL